MKTSIAALMAGLIAIGMVTTLVLPTHQTTAAIDFGGKITTGVLGTLMGKGS